MKLKLKSTLALLLALVLLLTAAVPAFAADVLPSGAVLVTESDTIKADDFTIIVEFYPEEASLTGTSPLSGSMIDTVGEPFFNEILF